MSTDPWFNAYPPDVDWHAEIPARPLYALLDDAAHRFPSHRCIDFMGRKFTFADVARQVEHAASGFQRLGVRKGTKVGLFLPNCPQFVVAYYGILKAGGTVVNFSPLYSEQEILHQVETPRPTSWSP